MTRDEIKAAGDLIAKLYKLHKDILDREQRAAFATTVSALSDLERHHAYRDTREHEAISIELGEYDTKAKSMEEADAEQKAYWANGANMIELGE